MALFSKPMSAAARVSPADNDQDPIQDPDNEVWDADEIDILAEQKAQRKRRNLTIVGILGAVIGSFALGLLVARNHYRAQKIVVSINGQVIDQDAFVHRMEVNSGAQTLQRMADEMLQDQYARKLGIAVPQSEIDARYRQLSQRPNFTQYLANTHLTPTDMVNQLRMEMIVNKIVERDVKLTEADIARYYKEQTDRNNKNARFYTPPIVTIAVIASSNKERVMKAKQELDRGGDFQAIAAAYSDDLTSKNHGGELPPITRGRTMSSNIPGMEKIIFGMKVGETIGPTAFGPVWTIIRCLKQEPEVTRTRDEVDYECRVGALMEKLPKSTAARIRADYAKFQQSANIHTFRPEFKMVFGGR